MNITKAKTSDLVATNKQLRGDLFALKTQFYDLQTRFDAKSTQCDTVKQQYSDVLALMSKKSGKKESGRGEWNPDAIHELVSDNQALKMATEALQSDKKDLQQELKSALVLIERMRLTQSNDIIDGISDYNRDNGNYSNYSNKGHKGINDGDQEGKERERSGETAPFTPAKESSMSPQPRLVTSRQGAFRSRLCGETAVGSPTRNTHPDNDNHVSFSAEIADHTSSPEHDNVFTLKSFFARSPGIKR